MDKKQSKLQRHWVASFLEKHGYTAKLVKTYNATCGYYYYTFRWHEEIAPYIPADTKDLDPGMAWLVKELYVELSPAAAERNKRISVVEIAYPRCSLLYKRQSSDNLQTVLSIPQVLEVNTCVKPKKTRARLTSKNVLQHSLPLYGVTALMNDIYQSHSEPIKSEQDLLSETTDYYSVELGKTVELPTAIALTLTEQNATPEEWESTVLLLGVSGEQGALLYAQSLPTLRKAKPDITI